MKLIDCNWCALSNIRERTSFSKGKKPSEVFILFDREPKYEKEESHLREFIQNLNTYLLNDYYYAFTIKCFQTQEKISFEHMIKCRTWLKNEIKVINPYLIIIMGNLSKYAILGKLAKYLSNNVFYIDESSPKKRQIFLGPTIYSETNLVKESLEVLLNFIKEYYRHG